MEKKQPSKKLSVNVGAFWLLLATAREAYLSFDFSEKFTFVLEHTPGNVAVDFTFYYDEHSSKYGTQSKEHENESQLYS